MNSIFETIPLESLPLPGLSLENIAGEAYLKIDSAEFGFVEYKASILERRPTERKAALLRPLDSSSETINAEPGAEFS